MANTELLPTVAEALNQHLRAALIEWIKAFGDDRLPTSEVLTAMLVLAIEYMSISVKNRSHYDQLAERLGTLLKETAHEYYEQVVAKRYDE